MGLAHKSFNFQSNTNTTGVTWKQKMDISLAGDKEMENSSSDELMMIILLNKGASKKLNR